MRTPGWYPSPDDPLALSYWDGQSWNAPLGPTAEQLGVHRSHTRGTRGIVTLTMAVAFAAAVAVQIALLAPGLGR
jgi:hypothetical protein